LYPEWPFAKLKHIPDTLARDTAIALLHLTLDSEAAKAADIAGWTIPLDYQPVHDCLRELQVSPYDNHGRGSLVSCVRLPQSHSLWLVL
jgi:hypothetical protein